LLVLVRVFVSLLVRVTVRVKYSLYFWNLVNPRCC
jgi:hypothetical protein